MIEEQQKEMHFTEQSKKEQQESESVGEFEYAQLLQQWPHTPITIFSKN